MFTLKEVQKRTIPSKLKNSRNGSPKNLLLLTIIFTFENTKKSP